MVWSEKIVDKSTLLRSMDLSDGVGTVFLKNLGGISNFPGDEQTQTFETGKADL
jgi:hypothetical protein